jgi:hypothetical protein
VAGAAYIGLMLELYDARRRGEAFDRDFARDLGETLRSGVEILIEHRNALCLLMWGGLLSDPDVFDAIIRHKKNTAREQVERGHSMALEQLRRFPIDRFETAGVEERRSEPVWVDEARPDSFHWKCDPFLAWRTTGPRSNDVYAAIDYLYAGWVAEYWQRVSEGRSARPARV